MFINNMEEFEAHYEKVADKVKLACGSEHFNYYVCRAGVAVSVVEILLSEIESRDAVILSQQRLEAIENYSLLLALEEKIKEQAL